MKLYPIPSDFIDNLTKLSWCDIRWTYDNGIIASDVPIKNSEEKY